MTDDLKQLITNAVAARGENTAVIAVFTRDLGDSCKIGIATCDLEDLTAAKESDTVLELCEEVGGEPCAVSIFRWPVGTTSDKILSDLTLQIDATWNAVLQGRTAVPNRHCWGQLVEDVAADEIAEQVAQRLAYCRERIELRTENWIPIVFYISVRKNSDGYAWGVDIIVTPEKLLALDDDEVTCRVFQDLALLGFRWAGVACPGRRSGSRLRF